MPNNEKGLAYLGKCPDNYSKYVYEMCTNVLKNSRYVDEYAGILYRVKYFEGSPKDMRSFYIHCGHVQAKFWRDEPPNFSFFKQNRKITLKPI
jgi:hypothetical protein